MSYRIAPGHQNHSPIGRALRDYNGSESYKHNVRGMNPNSIYDNKYEGYSRRETKHTLTSSVIVVILIVIAIILFGYILHCLKHKVPQDPEYFERITIFGGEQCPHCGNYPCTCGEYDARRKKRRSEISDADDIYGEIHEEKSNVVAGSTEDYIKGGSPEDDYEPII